MLTVASAARAQAPFAGLVARSGPALLQAARLTVAVSLALYLAFYLELETPYWAGTSACIVCQPVLGSTLRKGLFRMVGTAVGAVAAVALTAVFPQERSAFLFAMLLWVAACSFLSTMLRNYAAYAAMLAGYTLIIIAGTSIAAPDRVFEIALSRASEISIGIVSGTLVVALTTPGDAPRRLAAMLSQLIAETAGHLADVLGSAGTRNSRGVETRRALIRRAAALDPIIEQAVGEAPELLQRRSVLRSALNGLFEALSGVRIVETHLRSAPEAVARRSARIVLDQLPPSWRAGPQEGTSTARGGLGADGSVPVVRNLLRLGADDLSLYLTARGTADAATGLAAANNGLALLNDPARARDRLPSGFVVPDYLPALVNAFRVFLGVGAAVLFWIFSEWPNGPQAITFAAITIMVFSPMQERSRRAAMGQGIGTLMAAVIAAIIKFSVLPGLETFPGLVLAMSLGLAPLGALSTVPTLSPYFMPATLNFIPLLAPTNQTSYDTIAYLNNAMGLLGGCGFGVLALALVPPVSTRLRAQRLCDLTIRDLRRLAMGRRKWTLSQWQNRVYTRLTAMPGDAEPVLRSYLVSMLSAGLQLIRLQRLSRHGRIGVELSDVQICVAADDLAKLRAVIERTDAELAAIPDTQPGAAGRMRVRAALLAIVEAVDRQREYHWDRLS
ncbi:FUSC family protein [Mesorhizobium sp. KR2-14]|uniref:FUSC family protein n=1 Tax=Mesorhizobium sp. KR2-14 TaxID=3156610 RepID=UPI0032B42456